MASEKNQQPRAALAGEIHAKILSDSHRKNQQPIDALAGGIHAKLLPDSLAGGVHAKILPDSQSKNQQPLAALAGGIHAKILPDSQSKNQQPLAALAGRIHEKKFSPNKNEDYTKSVIQVKNKDPQKNTDTTMSKTNVKVLVMDIKNTMLDYDSLMNVQAKEIVEQYLIIRTAEEICDSKFKYINNKEEASEVIDFAHDEGDPDMITSLIQLGYRIDTEDFREYKNQKEKDKHWDDYIVNDENLRKILMSVPFTLVAASNWNTSKSVSILKKTRDS